MPSCSSPADPPLQSAGLIPLYFYQRKHPLNLVLLGVWVSLQSTAVINHAAFHLPSMLLPDAKGCICLTRNCNGLVLLLMQTALLSVSVGTTCTFYKPEIVLEALALTAAIVVALTVYTFNAARKGANFRYLASCVYNSTQPHSQHTFRTHDIQASWRRLFSLA